MELFKHADINTWVVMVIIWTAFVIIVVAPLAYHQGKVKGRMFTIDQVCDVVLSGDPGEFWKEKLEPIVDKPLE